MQVEEKVPSVAVISQNELSRSCPFHHRSRSVTAETKSADSGALFGASPAVLRIGARGDANPRAARGAEGASPPTPAAIEPVELSVGAEPVAAAGGRIGRRGPPGHGQAHGRVRQASELGRQLPQIDRSSLSLLLQDLQIMLLLLPSPQSFRNEAAHPTVIATVDDSLARR